MIFMHPPCTEEAERSVLYYPFLRFTLNKSDAQEFRSLIADYDSVVGVFSGHTHRNEVTYAAETGDLPYPETAATVEYPCGYNIYKVYTNGYIQSFYKCKRLDLSEANRAPMSGLEIEESYRFGDEGDRNFSFVLVDAPPMVDIVNPGDDATVAGSVTIQATVSDDGEIDGVKYCMDNGAYEMMSYNSVTRYWEATWDSTTVADGDHTVTVQAIDKVSNSSNDTSKFTVNNPIQPHMTDTAGGIAWWIWVIIGVVIATAVGGGLYVWRRRRAT